ncbi:MAG: hypothetical protein ACON5H_03665 [Akkermansiaceae bacterium]
MKIPLLLLTSFCLAAPLSAQQGKEKEAPKAEKAAEASQPSLTFYYFDG